MTLRRGGGWRDVRLANVVSAVRGGGSAPPTIGVVDLGRVDYDTADREQKAALARAIAGGPATLIVCEISPPIVTLGRGTRPGAVLAPGTPAREVERGGAATLHLPGQLVVYPVHRLPEEDRDVERWLRRLEAIVISTLTDFGLEGSRRAGATGVWIAGPHTRKIASVGVALRRWTSYHGFALNVDPDLDLFRAIRPCGFDAGVMTSMARELGQSPPFAEVKERAICRALEEIGATVGCR